jgi:hypothetical protein
LAPTADVQVDASSRVVRYTFSDESIGRDGHIVKADAWQTENFEKNPVFCWAHSDDEPPIGRVFDLHTESRELRGSVKYAETPLADTIYALVRGKFLNATSCSWLPIDSDPMGGYGAGKIFTSVDLLEISQVSVPALPSALAIAGTRGINVQPLRRWAERALDTGGSHHHLLPRREIEAIFRACRPARSSCPDDGLAYRRRRVAELGRAPAASARTDEDRRQRAVELTGRIRADDAVACDQLRNRLLS